MYVYWKTGETAALYYANRSYIDGKIFETSSTGFHDFLYCHSLTHVWGMAVEKIVGSTTPTALLVVLRFKPGGLLLFTRVWNDTWLDFTTPTALLVVLRFKPGGRLLFTRGAVIVYQGCGKLFTFLNRGHA
jgi:hypothetical protein